LIPLNAESPARTISLINYLLIIINFSIYFYQVSLDGGNIEFVFSLAVIPYEITHNTHLPSYPVLPHVVTLFSSLFLHGGFFHLAGNMLFLWIFGNKVEDAMGHKRYVLFYLLCGLIATTVQILMEPLSKIPMIGASGAIAGILGAYLILYPTTKIMTLIFILFFIRIIKISAFYFLFYWFAIQILNAFILPVQPGQGGIAFFAHIGGFIGGALLIKLFALKK